MAVLPPRCVHGRPRRLHARPRHLSARAARSVGLPGSLSFLPDDVSARPLALHAGPRALPDLPRHLQARHRSVRRGRERRARIRAHGLCRCAACAVRRAACFDGRVVCRAAGMSVRRSERHPSVLSADTGRTLFRFAADSSRAHRPSSARLVHLAREAHNCLRRRAISPHRRHAHPAHRAPFTRARIDWHTLCCYRLHPSRTPGGSAARS
jgi:hypothetical protein